MRAITLFAGAGGADLGMQRAGVQHLACVEGDATACATLRAAGFPAVHAWIGTPPGGACDIRRPELPGELEALIPRNRGRALKSWAWDGSPVDVFWASPPCQPYSAAGKQLGADDPRDGWPATVEAIHAVRPRWVIIENVGGAPVESWAAELGGLFARHRYPCVSWATLDAADWGLPSHRTRQFLVAGPEPYRWPVPTHCGPAAPVEARRRLLPWVGFGEALGLVGAVRATRKSEAGKPVSEREEQIIEGPCQCIGTGHGGLAGQPYVLLLPSAAVMTTEEKGTRASAASGGTFHGGPDRASDSLYLATGRRRLTWQECAVLLGFPAGYPFQGGVGAKYRQIGNAVAPVMAEALVRAIPTSAAGDSGR